MLNKNRDEIKKYITMAKEFMGPMPTRSEDVDYVLGWCSAQAETVSMMLDRIEGVINRKEEEEF